MIIHIPVAARLFSWLLAQIKILYDPISNSNSYNSLKMVLWIDISLYIFSLLTSRSLPSFSCLSYSTRSLLCQRRWLFGWKTWWSGQSQSFRDGPTDCGQRLWSPLSWGSWVPMGAEMPSTDTGRAPSPAASTSETSKGRGLNWVRATAFLSLKPFCLSVYE